MAFGPGPQFKGGIANYNTSLARALDRKADCELHIVSWTQQYPAIIPRDYIDRKTKEDKLAGTRIQVHYVLNYNRPGSWLRTARYIRDLQPDLVIIQWSIAIQGIPLRTVARKLQKYGIKVIFDLHFVVQKENSSLDRILTRRCIRFSDAYITHSMKTFRELEELLPDADYALCKFGDPLPASGKVVLKLFHPVYDMFKKDPEFDVQAFKEAMGLKKHVFLFFGFIRKYKGLHDVIQAFHRVRAQRDDVSLLIVGELFWNTLDNKKLSTKFKNALFGFAKALFLRKQDDERNYRPLDLIEELGLQEDVKVLTEFVPNEDVHKYFQASDAITLFYLTATPSGVESMAYNFGLPILATRVGHFSETIQDGYNGYLAEAGDTESMAGIMIRSLKTPIPGEHVYATSKEMSWDNYASSIQRIISPV